MNLMDVIQSQLTSQVTGKLASLIGGSEKQTQSAIGAAVPGLLAALGGVSSSGGKGADQLSNALGGFDTGMLGNLAGMLMKSPDKVQDHGGSLLGSMISGTVTAGLAGAISKFTGLNSGTVKKLLGFLTPMVMGVIAQQFKGKQVTPQGVSALFEDQKDNIKGALPSGFSLDGIPGLSALGADARQAVSAAQSTVVQAEQAGPSLLKRILPLAAIALLAWFAWQMLSKKPQVAVAPQEDARPAVDLDVPGVVAAHAKAPTDLLATYASATKAIGSITDVASATAALPQLNELNAKLNGLVGLWEKLPATVQTNLAKITRDNLSKLEAVIQPILAIPGVPTEVGPVLKEIVTKLQALGRAA